MTCEPHWMVDICVTRATEKSIAFQFSSFPLHTEWKSNFSPDIQALLELALPPFLQSHLFLCPPHTDVSTYTELLSVPEQRQSVCLLSACISFLWFPAILPSFSQLRWSLMQWDPILKHPLESRVCVLVVIFCGN